MRRSADLRQWIGAGQVFDAIPTWVQEAVPGVTNLWAPDAYHHKGT